MNGTEVGVEPTRPGFKRILGPPSREKTMRFVMVPRAGVEPARPFGQRILSPQRLPFRHPGKLSVTLILARLSRFPLIINTVT